MLRHLRLSVAFAFECANAILSISVPLFGVGRIWVVLDVVYIAPVSYSGVLHVGTEGIRIDVTQLVACFQVQLLADIVHDLNEFT